MSRWGSPEPPPGTALIARLERNGRGRDFVVGDVHGHFGTLRHALAELEVGEHDRVFSLGDLRRPRAGLVPGEGVDGGS